MKKIFYKISLMCFLAAGFASCEEDRVSLNYEDGPTQWSFGSSSSEFPVLEDSNVTYVDVGVTTSSSEDRQLPITIDPSSTALPSEYTIESSSLFVPAGAISGRIKITGNYATLNEGVRKTIIFTINEGVDVIDDNNFHIVNLFKTCPSDLAGTYSVTTTYGYHDFLPAYASNTMTTEITPSADGMLNGYSVADFSGGLYSVGPYATNYGTGTAGMAANRDLNFQVHCSAVTWTNQNDPYGSVVPTNNAVNSYDPATGVITISWTATAYGENGVSVYTPID